jgi:hypothetical protein
MLPLLLTGAFGHATTLSYHASQAIPRNLADKHVLFATLTSLGQSALLGEAGCGAVIRRAQSSRRLRSRARTFSRAMAVALLNRSTRRIGQCRGLRFLARRTPASEVSGLGRVQNERHATSLPAGQQTTVTDALATGVHRRLLGRRLTGCSIGDVDSPSGIRDRHCHPIVIGMGDRRSRKRHADGNRCYLLLHGLPGALLPRCAAVAQVNAVTRKYCREGANSRPVAFRCDRTGLPSRATGRRAVAVHPLPR